MPLKYERRRVMEILSFFGPAYAQKFTYVILSNIQLAGYGTRKWDTCETKSHLSVDATAGLYTIKPDRISLEEQDEAYRICFKGKAGEDRGI